MKNTEKILSLAGVKKNFGKRGFFGTKGALRALVGVNLDIMRGEVLSVVGESGSGKSTLGRCILDLYKPDGGSILYYGRSVHELSPRYAYDLLQRAERISVGIKRRTASAETDFTDDEMALLRLLGGFAVTDDVRLYSGLVRERMTLLSRLYTGGNPTEELTRVERALIYGERKHRQDPGFAVCHRYLDSGVELNRLTRSERRELTSDIGIVFQDPYSSLNPRMTAGELVAEGALTHGMFKRGTRELQRYVAEVARETGLDPALLSRFPHQFSGGQRQRICIARALAIKPRFLVLDECISALDVSVGAQIISLLLDLKEKEKLTYLFISHDLSVVRYISDRVAVMYLGRIVETGYASDIFEDPRHPYTVALLSSVPTAEGEADRVILEGTPPSPTSPPSGCPFHTRCPLATDICKTTLPEYREAGEGHTFLCHFPGKKQAKGGKIVLYEGE